MISLRVSGPVLIDGGYNNGICMGVKACRALGWEDVNKLAFTGPPNSFVCEGVDGGINEEAEVVTGVGPKDGSILFNASSSKSSRSATLSPIS